MTVGAIDLYLCLHNLKYIILPRLSLSFINSAYFLIHHHLFLTLKDGANAPAEGYASLAAAKAAGAVTLNIGTFINTVISFLIIAAAIFMVIQLLNKLQRKQEEEAAPAGPSEEVLLLRDIRDSLKK